MLLLVFMKVSFFTQLHYLFNVAHQMRLVVQREGGLDILKVIML